MERYAFLFIGLGLLAPLGVIFVRRRDLRPLIWRTGLYGGVAGLVAELFYFRDYWRPPTLVGVAHISPEDVIFGFSITALSAVVFPFWSGRSIEEAEGPRRKELGAMFGLGLAGLIALMLAGMNSIFASSGLFALFAGYIVLRRRDLVWPLWGSVVAVLAMILVVYGVLFGWMFPHYWERYWLLEGTVYGAKLVGRIPLTELLWYASWAAFAGVAHLYFVGKKLGQGR